MWRVWPLPPLPTAGLAHNGTGGSAGLRACAQARRPCQSRPLAPPRAGWDARALERLLNGEATPLRRDAVPFTPLAFAKADALLQELGVDLPAGGALGDDGTQQFVRGEPDSEGLGHDKGCGPNKWGRSSPQSARSAQSRVAL